MLHKILPILSKTTPFIYSHKPSFNTFPNHPKPSNPLFYKSFRHPHKIILTFYSHHPTFPYFVAQKKGHTSQCDQFLSFYLKKRGNEFLLQHLYLLILLIQNNCPIIFYKLSRDIFTIIKISITSVISIKYINFSMFILSFYNFSTNLIWFM